LGRNQSAAIRASASYLLKDITPIGWSGVRGFSRQGSIAPRYCRKLMSAARLKTKFWPGRRGPTLTELTGVKSVLRLIVEVKTAIAGG
jgi:hypothetical protein